MSSHVHASVVLIGEAGVLVRGASGTGKSSLSLALIEEAGRSGLFARLVGDDRVEILSRSNRLIARSHPAIAGWAERRGQGIVSLEHEAAAVLRLVIDMVSRDKTPRLPASADLTISINGLNCPHLSLDQDKSPVENAQAVLAFMRRMG
jgi:HPr kinase/phosphorylase